MKLEYNLGDIVFLKTDSDQLARMVIGINVRPNGNMFGLANGVNESWHFAIEMSPTKDILKAITSTN